MRAPTETERTGRTALVLGPAPAFPPAPGLGPIRSTDALGPIRIPPRGAPRPVNPARVREALIADLIDRAERATRALALAASAFLLGATAQVWLGAIGVHP